MCVQLDLDSRRQTREKPGVRPRGGVVTQRIANADGPLTLLANSAHSIFGRRSIPASSAPICTHFIWRISSCALGWVHEAIPRQNRSSLDGSRLHLGALDL